MPHVSSLRPTWLVVTPFMGFMVWLTWYVQDNGFFWDSILLASKYGQWYYQTHFSTLFVPAKLAGYPPLFGMYMAAGWHLFGKSLPVSHFLMLPFLLGIIWQVYLLAKHYVSATWLFMSMLLILLDPTLLAQSAQVAPDIVLLFLYLTCLNAILQQRTWILTLALAFMSVHTPRSQILIVAVLLTQVFLYWQEHGKLSLPPIKKMLPYLPAGFLLLGWQMLHYRHFGWVGYSRASDWGAYSAFVSPKGFARNLALIGWRLLDFGRIALWITTGALLWKTRKQIPKPTQELLIMSVVPLVTLTTVLVWFTNPIGHRYWLVVYVLFALLTSQLLQQVNNKGTRKMLAVGLMLSLITGHFWLYPQKVAKGWDATLAHLPYFTLRKQMMQYLNEHHIAWQKVGSDFPNLASPADTDLTTDHRQFPEKNLSTQQYIFYSNVFNGFSDQELDALQQDWMVLHEVKSGQIYMRLYTKKRDKSN